LESPLFKGGVLETLQGRMLPRLWKQFRENQISR